MPPQPRATSLYALVALCLSACTSIPQRFDHPVVTYAPPAPHRVRVVGFNYERFRATSASSSFGAGSAAAAGVGTVQGVGGTAQVATAAASNWHAGSRSVSGEYVTETSAPGVAALLAKTGCFEVVAGDGPVEYVFEGQRAEGYKAIGALRRALSLAEAFTLTPLLGAPLWGRAEGAASINVYRSDGTLVRSFDALVPVDYSTTIYSYSEDEPKTFATARDLAIRDAVEQAAASFCGQTARQ